MLTNIKARWLPGLMLSLWVALQAVAADNVIPRDDPRKMLTRATDRLLEIARAADNDEDLQKYYDQIEQVLDQVLDKQYFARGVMGDYASARRYRSLETREEKAAFRKRVFRFADALEKVLIQKYGDALLAFSGERIEIESLTEGDDSSGKAGLLQTIHSDDNKTYRVQYSLRQQKDGSWLITNIIVEGVNLGTTYRNQFADLVEKNQSNVDYVVDNWAKLMTQPQEKDSAGGSAGTGGNDQ